MSVRKWLARHPGFRALFPASLRSLARGLLGEERYRLHQWQAENPYSGSDHEFAFDGASVNRVGILADWCQQHYHYIAACLEMGVSYRVLDIGADDWMDQVGKSGCQGFLAWPLIWNTRLKRLWDDRVFILTQVMGRPVFPSRLELWLYESKMRIRDWLAAADLPRPRTWVFHREDQARRFLKEAPLPVVVKSDLGARSHGVRIVRTRSAAASILRDAFGSGKAVGGLDRRDRQWGYIIVQEYLPEVEEWRLVRVGDSYFCRYKIRKGDFHSGSGDIVWARPTRQMLDLARRVTDKGGFRSMNVDMFRTRDGRLLVNELHALFGGKPLPDGEYNGRYLYRADEDAWYFERGDFFRNICADLRVEQLLRDLGGETEERLTAWHMIAREAVGEEGGKMEWVFR